MAMQPADTPGSRCERFGNYSWRFFAPLSGSEVAAALACPARLLQPPGQPLKKAHPNSPSEVFRLPATASQPEPLAVKHYRSLRWRDRLKDVFRGSRAHRAAQWALTLKELGVPTIIPLAAGACHGRPWDSYLLSRLVEPTSTFHDFAAAHPRSLQRREHIEALARMLARLHDEGISHQDAHLGNFILHLKPRPSLFIVDLDGLRRFWRLTLRRVAKDLQRLLYHTPASRTEQLRFVLTYCAARREPIDPKALLGLIQEQYAGPHPLSTPTK